MWSGEEVILWSQEKKMDQMAQALRQFLGLSPSDSLAGGANEKGASEAVTDEKALVIRFFGKQLRPKIVSIEPRKEVLQGKVSGWRIAAALGYRNPRHSPAISSAVKRLQARGIQCRKLFGSFFYILVIPVG